MERGGRMSWWPGRSAFVHQDGEEVGVTVLLMLGLGLLLGLLVNVRRSLPRCRVCNQRPGCLCVRSRDV